MSVYYILINALYEKKSSNKELFLKGDYENLILRKKIAK